MFTWAPLLPASPLLCCVPPPPLPNSQDLDTAVLTVLSGNRVMDGTGSFNTVFDPVKVLPYLVIPDPGLPPFVIDPVGTSWVCACGVCVWLFS